jgi:hypothetical protein
MLGTSTSAQSNLSRLALPIPLYLLLPQVFLRLYWFSWCFLRLDALALLFKIKVFLALLDWILRYTLFQGFDTLGSHLREEGSLDYDRGLVRLQVQTKFDTHIHRQQRETQNLDAKLEIDSLKSSLVDSDEVDCGDCFVLLAHLTTLKEKHGSNCEELDVIRVELVELQSRPTLLGACTLSCLA